MKIVDKEGAVIPETKIEPTLAEIHISDLLSMKLTEAEMKILYEFNDNIRDVTDYAHQIKRTAEELGTSVVKKGMIETEKKFKEISLTEPRPIITLNELMKIEGVDFAEIRINEITNDTYILIRTKEIETCFINHSGFQYKNIKFKIPSYTIAYKITSAYTKIFDKATLALIKPKMTRTTLEFMVGLTFVNDLNRILNPVEQIGPRYDGTPHMGGSINPYIGSGTHTNEFLGMDLASSMCFGSRASIQNDLLSRNALINHLITTIKTLHVDDSYGHGYSSWLSFMNREHEFYHTLSLKQAILKHFKLPIKDQWLTYNSMVEEPYSDDYESTFLVSRPEILFSTLWTESQPQMELNLTNENTKLVESEWRKQNNTATDKKITIKTQLRLIALKKREFHENTASKFVQDYYSNEILNDLGTKEINYNSQILYIKSVSQIKTVDEGNEYFVDATLSESDIDTITINGTTMKFDEFISNVILCK